jgi:hypothetical protein
MRIGMTGKRLHLSITSKDYPVMKLKNKFFALNHLTHHLMTGRRGNMSKFAQFLTLANMEITTAKSKDICPDHCEHKKYNYCTRKINEPCYLQKNKEVKK